MSGPQSFSPGYLPSPQIPEAEQKKSVSTSAVVFLNVVNALTQLLIGAVVFCAFSFANIVEFPRSLPQHIYLCVIGYVILMSQAVLSFNDHAGWAHSLKYADRRMIHGIMQILGSILAIIGSAIRLVDHGRFDRFIFTAHGVCGIIAMAFTILSLLGGILNFIIPAKMNSAPSKIMHTCIGSFSLIIAFITLSLGFDNWYRYFFGNANANLAIGFTVFAILGILISGFSRTVLRLVK